MKVLKVCFKEIELGQISFNGEIYTYVANEKNVKKAHEKGYQTFLFGFDESFETNEFPASLSDLIPDKEQIDIFDAAGINETDAEFEKLCKIASLDLQMPDFHIETI